jgi:hypothetical protein
MAVRRRAFRSILALTACAALLAGCGGARSGAGSGGASGTKDQAANAVPAGAVFFADANIDTGSNAWTKLEKLGSRFPAWNGLVAQVENGLKSQKKGVSFDSEVKPWLGTEAAVAVTGVSPRVGGGPKATYIAYVESKDDGKLEAAIVHDGTATPAGTYRGYALYRDSSSPGMEAAVGHGALLLASDDATLKTSINTREGTGSRLADSAAFKDAMGKLPSDSLAVAYVDGASLAQLASLAVASSGSSGPKAAGVTPRQASQLLNQLGAIRAIALSAGAEDAGFRIHAAVLANPGQGQTLGLRTGGSFTPSLTALVPGNAYAFLSFSNLGPALQTAVRQYGGAKAARQLHQLQARTGLSVQGDLAPLLSGENAVYVAPGLPYSVGMLLKPHDINRAVATMRKVTTLVRRQGGKVTSVPGGASIQTGNSGTAASWRRVGDVIAISNDPSAGSARSDSLQASQSFGDALSAAGAKGPVTGLLYANLGQIINAVTMVSGTAVSSTASANLAHLGALVLSTKASGDTATVDAFVTVK